MADFLTLEIWTAHTATETRRERVVSCGARLCKSSVYGHVQVALPCRDVSLSVCLSACLPVRVCVCVDGFAMHGWSVRVDIHVEESVVSSNSQCLTIKTARRPTQSTQACMSLSYIKADTQADREGERQRQAGTHKAISPAGLCIYTPGTNQPADQRANTHALTHQAPTAATLSGALLAAIGRLPPLSPPLPACPYLLNSQSRVWTMRMAVWLGSGESTGRHHTLQPFTCIALKLCANRFVGTAVDVTNRRSSSSSN